LTEVRGAVNRCAWAHAICVLGLLLAGCTQTRHLRGTAVDAVSGLPIAGATVEFKQYWVNSTDPLGAPPPNDAQSTATERTRENGTFDLKYKTPRFYGYGARRMELETSISHPDYERVVIEGGSIRPAKPAARGSVVWDQKRATYSVRMVRK
jgi:hypothetical protein